MEYTLPTTMCHFFFGWLIMYIKYKLRNSYSNLQSFYKIF